MEPLPVWRLRLQCLAVGYSSTDCDENTQELHGRQGSEVAEGLSPLPVTLFLELQVLADAHLLGD